MTQTVLVLGGGHDGDRQTSPCPGPAGRRASTCSPLLAGALPTIPLARRLLPRTPDRANAVAWVGLLAAALLAVLTT